MTSISLGAETAYAALGALVAGIGSFTGALTATNATNGQALETAGIAAGITALTFFGNSLRNWLQARGITVSGGQSPTPPQPPPLGG